jgi:hypothetical protein
MCNHATGASPHSTTLTVAIQAACRRGRGARHRHSRHPMTTAGTAKPIAHTSRWRGVIGRPLGTLRMCGIADSPGERTGREAAGTVTASTATAAPPECEMCPRLGQRPRPHGRTHGTAAWITPLSADVPRLGRGVAPDRVVGGSDGGGSCETDLPLSGRRLLALALDHSDEPGQRQLSTARPYDHRRPRRQRGD